MYPFASIAQSVSNDNNLSSLLGQLQTLQGNGSGFAAKESGGLGGVQNQLGPPSRLQLLQEKQLIREIEAAELAITSTYCRTGAILPSSSKPEIELLLSSIERDFCRRASEPLKQFGYEILKFSGERETAFSGAIQDDYRLGIGDEIIVTFHGQTQGVVTERVDREGRITIGELPPTSVVGLTIGQFRRNLETRVAASMIGTDVFVSLGAVRAISVIVAGEVNRPGLTSLTSQSTVIDALALAGGVKKTGSLRKIQIFRGDKVHWVDIYELILGSGLSHNLSILDGDRIIVPSIGSTIAVTGRVKRPAVFELSEGRSAAGIGELLELAGGLLRPNGNIYSHLAFDAAGREVVRDHTSPVGQVRNGEIINVRLNQNVQLNTAELLGHVNVQKRRSISTTPTVSALLGEKEELRDNPYILFAVLDTIDPATRARRLFPLNLQSIMKGEKDYMLRDQDRLIILGTTDIQYLMSNDVQEVLQFGRAAQDSELFGKISLRPQTNIVQKDEPERSFIGNPVQQVLSEFGLTNSAVSANEVENEEEDRTQSTSPKPGKFACRGLQSLATIASTTGSERFVQAFRATGLNGGLSKVNPLPCPPIYDLFPNLLPFLLEHVVAVDGEVRSPGAYPILNETPLSSVVAVAGGLTRDADLKNLELTRFVTEGVTTPSVRKVIDVIDQGFENISINAGDVIKFNRAFTDRDAGPVLLSGEFVRPGLFDIRRGERLSEVIARAGGLRAQAYPYGAVFTRERVKKAQQAGFQRAQRELTSAATFAATKSGVDPAAVIALQQITSELNSVEAVGRVVIEADPTALQVRPEFDTVLEPGDKIFMPKRPNSVLVIGDVLNPGALQFLSGQNANAYIQQAGGFQQSADQDRVFVVFPNGVAQPVSVSVWNYNPSQVPPGSTIVAPKNPAPLDFFSFAEDIGALVSQLAITTASLYVIGN